MNALFICNQNQNRSKTAEIIFNKRFNTKSAGLYNEKPVNKKQTGWADVVFVMEEEQRSELSKRFPYGDPELVKLLQLKVKDSNFSKI